jgi:LPXTG-site transpeptidase (sortase) family protein
MRSLLSITAALLVAVLSVSSAYADDLTVSIPDISVSAATERLGVVDDVLSAPDDPDSLGVFEFGEQTIIAGHRDWQYRLRAFSRLDQLQQGAEVDLSDGRSYSVDSTAVLDVDDADAWSSYLTGDDSLVLVTCTGPFSLSRHEYLQRFVVLALPN